MNNENVSLSHTMTQKEWFEYNKINQEKLINKIEYTYYIDNNITDGYLTKEYIGKYVYNVILYNPKDYYVTNIKNIVINTKDNYIYIFYKNKLTNNSIPITDIKLFFLRELKEKISNYLK